MSENALLREFAATRSEAAFAALVRQHLNLVFATALRQIGDRSLAEEISQDVFTALAKKAGALGSFTTIAGWLYKATLLECRRRLRSELRRHRREDVAAALRTVAPEPESDLRALVPLLDEALLALRESDRLAVMLRFLEEKPLREVGAVLGVSEDAARKRVAKALEHLTEFFRQRGFAVSVTATVPLLAAATHAAPAGLAAAVTTTALTQSAAASGVGLTISNLIAMTTKTKLTTAAATALLLAAVISPVVLRDRARLKAELGQLRSQLAEASAQQASAIPQNVVFTPPALGSTVRQAPSLLAVYERGAMTVEEILAALQRMPSDLYQSTEEKLRRQALLAQLRTNEVQTALELAAQIPDLSQRQSVCEWLLGQWLTMDGAAALNYARKLQKGTLRDGVIHQLAACYAAHKPEEAIAWFQGAAVNHAAADDSRLVLSMAAGLARSDFHKALAFAGELPVRPLRMKALETVAQAAEDDAQRTAVMQVVERLPERNDQKTVLTGLAGGWALRDPAATAAWVGTLPAEDQHRVATKVFSTWIQHDPERAADFMVGHGGPGTSVSQVIQTWTERDPVAAGEWLRRQPEGPGSDSARKLFAHSVKDIAPAVAMEWANAIQQTQMRRQAYFQLFTDWKTRDPSAANEFLAKCGWSAERLQELRQEVER